MEITPIPVDGYETVVEARDPETGLHAMIAIHDTTLGPALGGMRIWPYASREEALQDVLRLAEGMTYKSAIAHTGLGGGKSVVIGDPDQVRRPETLQAMGRFIDSLDGRYITAEDVNTRVEDLEIVAKQTRWVTGLSRERGGSGNPSPYTALGVFHGIRTCFEEVFGTADVAGRHVAVQGTGAVARNLIDRLIHAGASVTACDIKPEKIARVRERHPEVAWVEPDAIYDVPCDVFAPHALGAVLNDRTIPRLKCRIVAGAANNQLEADVHGDRLNERSILYAPDFVINAGGIINVSCELAPGGYDERTALERIEHIRDALRMTFEESRRSGTSTNQAALAVARRILEEARSKH